MSDLQTNLRTAAHATWQWLKRALIAVRDWFVWFVSPLVSSAQGQLNTADFRAMLIKMIGVGGVTWTAFRESLHDREVQEALITITLAVFAGAWEGWQRKRHGHNGEQPPATPLPPTDQPAPAAPPATPSPTGP